MAQTLMRATRLAQVISVLGNEKDLETTVERAAIEVGELFFADMALLILESGDGTEHRRSLGRRATRDLPPEPFSLPAVEEATSLKSVCIGAAAELPLPDWLAAYSPRHVAWARLLVGEKSLGLMLLARRGDEPFEESEATELRAVAYRIALAIENGLLHKRMTDQLAQLHRLQQLTAVLAGHARARRRRPARRRHAGLRGGRLVERRADRSTAASSSCCRARARRGELVIGRRAGDAARLDDRWKSFPLEVADKTVGVVAVTGAPAVGSEEHQLLLHLVSLGALSLDKALLHEQSREQARHDSLTGLLGHRVFHEVLEQQIAAASPFSVLLFDIDDFKQINDLHGHQTGDHALRLVAEALRQGTRSGDSVFRIGGEEFCALLPGLTEKDAFSVAEGVRQKVAAILSTLPNPVTVSVGVASFPAHGRRRDELLSIADAALYASKRGGKNRTSVPGGEAAEEPGPVPARGRPRPAAPEGPRHRQPQRPRRDPHGGDRPCARARRRPPRRPEDRRTPARHRQARGARHHPEQGRRARRGRVPHHQDAPGGRRRAAAELGARRARHHRPAASRAHRRLRLPVRAARRRDPPREPDRARRRRVRRDDARPAVSQGDAAGGGVRRARAPQRHAVRSRCRRGAHRHRAARPSATLDAIRTEPPSTEDGRPLAA